MRKIILLTFAVGFIMGCDKDDDPVDVNANGGTLDKLITVNDGDSLVTQFNYDAQGRLIGYVSTEYPGAVVGFTDVFTRDNNGRIIKASSSELNFPPSETYVTYQPGSSMFKHTVSYYNQQLTDSSTYVYANGNVTRYFYYYDPSTSSFYYGARSEYILQNGNPVNHKYYYVSSGFSTLNFEEQYTYDTKAPPFQQSFEESFLTEMDYSFTKNNVTKIVYIFTGASNFDETSNTSFTYAASGQPLTGEEVWTPSGEVYKLKYIYK